MLIRRRLLQLLQAITDSLGLETCMAVQAQDSEGATGRVRSICTMGTRAVAGRDLVRWGKCLRQGTGQGDEGAPNLL